MTRNCMADRRFRPALVLAVGALCLVLAAPSAARSRREPRSPELEEVYRLLDHARETVHTFRAELTERRRLAMLEKEQVYHARIAMDLPGRIRLEYDSPERRVYVLDGGRLVGWIPSRNRVEKMDLSRRKKRIQRLLALGQDGASLEREFRVRLADDEPRPGTAELVLVPRSRRIRRRVREIRLWIDRKLGIPRAIRYTTGDDNVVEIELSRVEINPEIPAQVFRLEIPPGAKVVRGLRSLGFDALAEAGEDVR